MATRDPRVDALLQRFAAVSAESGSDVGELEDGLLAELTALYQELVERRRAASVAAATAHEDLVEPEAREAKE